MGDLPTFNNWKVYCVMETFIFSWIGYILIFCGALCVVAPLLVFIVNIIVAHVWGYIDEGDSEIPNILKVIAPVLFTSYKLEAYKRNTGYYIKNSEGKYYDKSDRKFWDISCVSNGWFASEEECKDYIKNHDFHGDSEFRYMAVFFAYSGLTLLGGGLLVVPTITLYLLSLVGTALSLRWSRRGYKKIKALAATINKSEDKQ